MTPLRQVTCERCGRTVDEGDHLWDEARQTESCPFCGGRQMRWPAEAVAPPTNRYRTIGRRSLALSIDGVVMAPLGVLYRVLSWRGASMSTLILAYVAEIAVPLAYTILCHGLFGQTIGKRVCGVAVVDVSEKPLSMRQAVLRNVVSLAALPFGLIHGVSNILGGIDPHGTDLESLDFRTIVLASADSLWFLVDAIAALTNPKRRAIHDFIAGSVVVRTE